MPPNAVKHVPIGPQQNFATGAERLKQQQFRIVNMDEWSVLVDGQLTVGARPGAGTVESLGISMPSRQNSND